MQTNERVADVVVEVLARQASARAERAGEAFEVALEAILEVEASRQLGEPRDGQHRDRGRTRGRRSLPPARDDVSYPKGRSV